MRTILVPALLALALTIPAAAEGCVPTTSEADVTVGSYYVDDALSCSDYTPEACQVRVCPPGGPCVFESALFWTWIYEETNGMPGLQRDDEIVDDTCGGLIAGDTILY